jgi:hypothetical protein
MRTNTHARYLGRTPAGREVFVLQLSDLRDFPREVRLPCSRFILTALKQAVAVLAGYGRLMALVAKGHDAPGSPPWDLQQDLSRTRALVATVEQRLHEFVRASLNSWECRNG